ncbi:hypothetical protein KVK32_07550 [Helicobacter pylori]|nr:hypothetical protein KVK32_07550 [Helicobacter pylori]
MLKIKTTKVAKKIAKTKSINATLTTSIKTIKVRVGGLKEGVFVPKIKVAFH